MDPNIIITMNKTAALLALRLPFTGVIAEEATTGCSQIMVKPPLRAGVSYTTASKIISKLTTLSPDWLTQRCKPTKGVPHGVTRSHLLDFIASHIHNRFRL